MNGRTEVKEGALAPLVTPYRSCELTPRVFTRIGVCACLYCRLYRDLCAIVYSFYVMVLCNSYV